MSTDDHVWSDQVACMTLAFTAGMDYWDQPDGPWGEEANARYRLGGAALARYDESAASWLREAVDEEHPGAAFRMALWAFRQDYQDVGKVWLVRAADLGHGDATQLLDMHEDCEAAGIRGHRLVDFLLAAIDEDCQDLAFAPEVARLLARS
ncbi:hypothetical protein [Streptomyces sp. NRRL S-378]|uniref:hypothetical protein n=1 Tax=Streptomyces sp. NRRL S-378 TaxID=1463904 RepID=UPI0004C5FF6E|nr:hypothetical protein [Streptomyces sp. NRRL S-378]